MRLGLSIMRVLGYEGRGRPTFWSDIESFDAGWSSLVARRAHNPKVVGSNPAPATSQKLEFLMGHMPYFCIRNMEKDNLKEIIEPIVRDHGCDFWGLEISQGKNIPTLRVFIAVSYTHLTLLTNREV